MYARSEAWRYEVWRHVVLDAMNEGWRNGGMK